jgi:preprotein translocase subunit SecY
MSIKRGMSKITRRNWWIDAVLFGSALTAALSGLYFLYLPSGGYQGGRNPYYNIQFLFSRHSWGDLHMWSGIVMIAVVAIHLTLHWSWVVNMIRRTLRDFTGKNGKTNRRSRFNLLLNLVVGLSFLVTAISGIYLLFVPGGRGSVDPIFLFSRITWDLIHTWAGVTLIVAGVIHFAIHWRWVVNVSTSISKGLMPLRWSSQSQRVITGER